MQSGSTQESPRSSTVELRFDSLAEGFGRAVTIVVRAEELEVGEVVAAAEGEGLDVVDLEIVGGVAAMA